MNRVTSAIESMRVNIAHRIAAGFTTQAAVDATANKLDMDLQEYVMFQERKSIAAGNKLTAEEAQTIYCYLGNTLEHFNSQAVEVKVILTKIFSELLQST